MDSAIFKSDIEIKYPPQNKWPFKKKKIKGRIIKQGQKMTKIKSCLD